MTELLSDGRRGGSGRAFISFADQDAHCLPMESQTSEGDYHDQYGKRQNDEDKQLKSQPLQPQTRKALAAF